MNNRITLTFVDNHDDFFSFDIILNENVPKSVLDIWSSKLMHFVDSKCGKVQTRYSAFNIPGRDVEYLADRLEKVIAKINSSWLNTEYGYEIEVTEIPRDYPVEVHNIVHHHFELLIGQVWDYSNWFQMVLERRDWNLANAIFQLNEISHELEEALDDGVAPHLHTLIDHCIDNDSRRSDLFNSDLPEEVSQIFTVGNVPGAVYIQYSQTGKTMLEVLSDEDDHIHDNNITAHRVTNGSMSICFGGSDGGNERQEELLNYLNRLAEERGIDLDNPNYTLGRPEIGRIDTEDIEHTLNMVRQHPNLYSIEFNGVVKIVNSFIDREF